MTVKDFSDEINKHLSGDLVGDLKEVTVEFNTDTGYMEVYIPGKPLHKIPAAMWTDYNRAWRTIQDLSDGIGEYLSATGQKPFVQEAEWANPWPF